VTDEQLNEMVQQWPVKARPIGLRYDGGGFYNLDGEYFPNEHAILLHLATGMLYAGVGVDEGINGRFWTFTAETSNPYRPDVETVKYDTPIEAVHAAVMATAAVAAKWKGKQ